MILDFDNGIITDGARSDIGIKSFGLEVPQLEVTVTESGVLDGGTVGASRAKSRRIVCQVLHDEVWDRETIMRAFTKGVLRTLRGPRGSIPYYVELLTFPDSLIEARREFTVSMVSPVAYPLGERRSVSTPAATGAGLAFPISFPISFEQIPAVTNIGVSSESDETSPCHVTLVMAVSASDISMTVSGRTCTITGALSIGDAIEVDSELHTVTVNGANRISWFDRAGKWPTLDPGYNLITWTRLARATVEWSPRMMGLV